MLRLRQARRWVLIALSAAMARFAANARAMETRPGSKAQGS